jgi:hypothetical protein
MAYSSAGFFCPKHHGTGQRHPCPDCLGSGKKWPDRFDERWTLCKKCDGSGDLNRCSFCGKRGAAPRFEEGDIKFQVLSGHVRKWLIMAVALHYRDQAGDRLRSQRHDKGLCENCGRPMGVSKYFSKLNPLARRSVHLSCRAQYDEANQQALSELLQNQWGEDVLNIAKQALSDQPYTRPYM